MFEIKNELGLHARPASMIVQEAKKYKSTINFIKDGVKFNAKSIMSIMSMDAKFASKFEIECIGEDELEAKKGIINLLNSL
ncbi:HPr family phosphocarrier protein [Helicovermis profundi]|uniref:Phosphocarrier protein HPr n=1 Tax=Helicovermis profundi TaxID=3065157 RepID=A0AAU9EEG3_9FIRM|nr:HPr family phosphocarrier protein [Clostridia bacterium S502]